MTEKQFINHNDSIINSKTDELVNASSDVSAEIITHWLNELNDENQRLKKAIESLLDNLEDDYIIIERDKNPKEVKYCRDCLNYETEYEEVYAFGEYETLTKSECKEGHHILDESDATNCSDFIWE